MLRILLLCQLLIISCTSVLCDSYHAEINVNMQYNSKGISPYVNGGFIEVVLDFVNGSLGFAAQELINRGFDLPYYETGVSSKWFMYFRGKVPSYFLNTSDMVNQNGVYSQVISNPAENNLAGISQITYFSNAGCDFYVYLKSKDSINVRFKIIHKDFNDSTLFEGILGKPDNEWKKYQLSIPANLNIHKAKLLIYFIEKGTLYLDEASLLPKDHVNQVRKEYFDLYSQWKPGIIRFPGGTFADEHAAHWFHGIGNIDQRHSPNLYVGECQRFEVGINEFLNFCQQLKVEPQFVTNMQYGSPNESSGLVEYLNSGVNTFWGGKREEHGFPKPFKVKYFEIGNEQWDHPDSNAIKFKQHAIEMKKVDTSIEIIFGGNLWGYSDFFNTSVDIAGDYFNSYGWHFVHYADSKLLLDTMIYKVIMAGSQGHQKFINMFRDWRNIKNRYDMKLSITELWSAYFGIDWFFTDRLFSLESALWTADIIMQCYENFDLIDIVNRTSNSGIFERGFDNSGKRVIQGSPTFHALVLLSNHSGKYFHHTNVESPVFDVEHPNLNWAEYNVPWFRAVVTSDNDSIYIAVINKHPVDECVFTHNLKLLENKTIKHYELYSDNFKDRNNVDGSNIINPVENDINSQDTFRVKKNSFNIFAISRTILSANLNPDTRIIIFPNPAYNSLEITNLPAINYKISVYDFGGKLALRTFSSAKPEISLDLRTMSGGVYFMILTDTNGKNTNHLFFKF